MEENPNSLQARQARYEAILKQLTCWRGMS